MIKSLFDPKVKIGKLANGLTYYIRKQKARAKVELRLVVNTSSIMEDDDQQGPQHTWPNTWHSMEPKLQKE